METMVIATRSCLEPDDMTTIGADRVVEIRAAEYFAALTGLHVRRRTVGFLRSHPDGRVVFDISRVAGADPAGPTRIETRAAKLDDPPVDWRPVPRYMKDLAEAFALLELLHRRGVRTALYSDSEGHSCRVTVPGSIDRCTSPKSHPAAAAVHGFLDGIELLPIGVE